MRGLGLAKTFRAAKVKRDGETGLKHNHASQTSSLASPQVATSVSAIAMTTLALTRQLSVVWGSAW